MNEASAYIDRLCTALSGRDQIERELGRAAW